MNYHFFHILAIDSQAETERLNSFLQTHPIHSIDRQFVADANNSFWSICVVTLKQEKLTHKGVAEKRSKIDYQEILSPEHFAVFSSLRTIRNQIAGEQNIPAYAVFTNEQLGNICQLNKVDINSISTIKGISGKRLNEYTPQLLTLYNASLKTSVNAKKNKD